MSAGLIGLTFSADMGTCQRKLVLLKLVDHCHDDGTKIYPAFSTVAGAAQCSVRSVQREMKRFVETGLLTLVREGGKGQGSTNEYALNLEALGQIKVVGWDAWSGATTSSGSAESAGEIKGDTLSPKKSENGSDPRVTDGTLRVTGATLKGDTRSHTTPYEPLEPLVERERASAPMPDGSEGEQPDGSTSGGTTSGDVFKKRFWPKWPGKAIDNRDRAQNEFDQLSPEEQEKAIACIVLFHEAQKQAKRTKPLAAATYLKQRKWQDLEGEPAVGAKYIPPTVKPFSPLWSAAFIEMLRTGMATQKRFVFKQLCDGQGTSLAFGRQRDGELIAASESFERVPSSSERWKAWQGWMEQRLITLRIGMHHMPRFRDDPGNPFWLSVPSAEMTRTWEITLEPPARHAKPTTDDDAYTAFR